MLSPILAACDQLYQSAEDARKEHDLRQEITARRSLELLSRIERLGTEVVLAQSCEGIPPPRMISPGLKRQLAHSLFIFLNEDDLYKACQLLNAHPLLLRPVACDELYFMAEDARIYQRVKDEVVCRRHLDLLERVLRYGIEQVLEELELD